MDTRATELVDIGFYVGSMLWPPLKFLFSIHVAWLARNPKIKGK